MQPETFIADHPHCVLVDIIATKGSAPRDAGTFMLVSAEALWGTIGGGNLEFVAVDHARRMLAGEEVTSALSITLGPNSGQCCGGVVELAFRAVDADLTEALERQTRDERQHYPEVYLFGAGHVGRALAEALQRLPLRLVVVETRADEIQTLPKGVDSRLTPMPEALVCDIAPGGAAVILTHDHALDFLIAAEALRRQDLGYVGMIGSKTKRGVFSHWLTREGLADVATERLVLPIGASNIKDKRPEVIAALVASELLQALL